MRGFLQSSLRLHLRLMKQPLVTFIIMVLAALLVSGGVSLVGNSLMAGRQFSGLQIAVADKSESGQALRKVELLAKKQDTGNIITVVGTSSDEAMAMLQNGQVAAAFIIPDGFMAGMYGDSIQPVPEPDLYLDSSRPLDMLLAKTFVESAMRTLSGTKDGVNFVMHVYDESGATEPGRSNTLSYIRQEFDFWLLSRDGMFRNILVSPTGSLTVAQYYLLGTLSFFALLSTPVLYGIYSFRRQKNWIDRLRAAGGSLRIYGLAKLISGMLLITAMLTLLLACAAWVGNSQALPTLSTFVGIFVCACFLSCFAFLACNTGSVLSATIFTFLFSTAGLFVSGGLVPPVFLPPSIRALSPYSPLTWMRDSLAPVFGLETNWSAVLAMLGLTLLLFLGTFLYSWRLERRWAG